MKKKNSLPLGSVWGPDWYDGGTLGAKVKVQVKQLGVSVCFNERT